MVKQRNIVDLNDHRQQTPSRPTITLPQLVVSAQRRAKLHLKTLLAEFFSKVDDRLFDLADKAENNQMQALYFDAMRSARLKKEEMEKTYFNELVIAFRDGLESTPSSAINTSLEQIGLVDDEALENDLAITNMVSSAETLFREALFGLTARLNFLIEDIEITKDNNPLRPEVFCQAFTASVKLLDADIKVNLVIYKLFDKFVIQQLGPMYNAINADLISAGVLPRIKSTIRKADDHSPMPGRTASVQNDGADAYYDGSEQSASYASYYDGHNVLPEINPDQPENLFSSLQELLSMARGGSGASGPGATGSAPSRHAGHGTVTGGHAISGTGHAGAGTVSGHGAASGGQASVYYAPQDVISALSHLQSNSDVMTFTGNSENGSAESIKSTVIQQISQLQGDDQSKQMGQTDTDAIDIVSMLFDFILDDPSLSDHLKAQLARLQIPMLKVAIIDKSFFAKKTHPARHLLNEMAYAGGTLDENQLEEDATYQMVCYVVDRVLNEFEQDTSIFETLLDEFTNFIEKERESNRLAEEMLEQARDTAAREIQRRITDNQVPPLVNNILITAWRDVLIHLCLRDGEESTAWNTALQVADDLIWSIQPKLVVAERQRLIKVIPRVLNGLRDGLTLIRYDAEATEQLFAGLETLHIASLRGSSIEPEANAAVPTLTDQVPESVVEPLLSSDEFGRDLDALSKDIDASNQLMDEDNILEEIVLSSGQELPWDQTEANSELEADLKEMALGTWVEFFDPDSERSKRGKLAWKCDFTGEYTFVDRKYKVVADLSFKQLVEKFELNQAQVVEDIPLFDRALDSVIGGIKNALNRSHNDPEPALS